LPSRFATHHRPVRDAAALTWPDASLSPDRMIW
jgi:hypothetical protein